MVKALSAPMLFDYMAIVMDKQALADEDFTVNVTLPDVDERHMLRVKNGVLLTRMMENMNQFQITGTNPFNIIEP